MCHSISLLRLIVFFLFIFSGHQIQAQVNWTVSADRKSVAAGEQFQISYTLQNLRGSNFQSPNFKYFTKLRGPSTQSSTHIVNGRSNSSITYIFVVIGEKPGRFPLPSASISIGGKVYKTKNDFRVEVTKGKVKPAGGSEKNPVMLSVTLSDSVAVVGQPLELEIKLHSLRSQIDFDVLGAPSFDNFYKETNNRRTNRVTKENIDGQQYFSKVLGNFTLYPLQEGRLDLEPYRLLVNMATTQQPRRRSFFDFGPRNYESFNVASAPLRLDIKPLPPGAPPNFSGAVGTLDVSCRVDRSILTTDDVVTLEMKIFGVGDTKQIQAPILESTDSLEVYPAKLREERQEERSWGFEKVKVYEYAILPKYKGSYQLKPNFIYFDTDSLTYVDKSCRVINLRVTQGSSRKSTVTKQPVIDDGLEELAVAEEFKGLPSAGLSGGVLWSLISAMGLAFIGMIGFRYYLDNQPDVDYDALRMAAAQKVALAQLAEAQAHLQAEQVKPFYESLSAALYGYLVDKLKVPPADLNLSNITATLAARQVPETLIQTFSELVKSAQMALYAGSQAKENMTENFEAAKAWIIKMEEWLGR